MVVGTTTGKSRAWTLTPILLLVYSVQPISAYASSRALGDGFDKGGVTLDLQAADYPADRFLKGKPVLPTFQGGNAWAATFRTRIHDSVELGPNFAGRYIVVEMGCGTGCLTALLVDGENGNILDLPLGGEAHYQLSMTYSVNSRLLQAVWMDVSSENSNECIAQAYLISDGEFDLLEEASFTVPEFGHCSPY